MKKHLPYISATIIVAFLLFSLTTCNKTEKPILYEKGTFPDTTIALEDLNSQYDDYNVTYYEIYELIPLIFSSNRGSNGGQFDLIQGALAYNFDKTTGTFILMAGTTNDTFFNQLITKANTEGNDFGPYRLYSSLDGLEYMILSSASDDGDLDFFYTKNNPYFGSSVPEVYGPFPVNLLNSASDEAYICFDTNQDSAYYSSNADGNFDIYLHKRPAETYMDTWLSGNYESSEKAEIFNSSSDDKCPYIYRKIMVFASDRPGGMGGFDLYYSLFSGGKWNTPVNLGPSINTASDEYRPVLGGHEEFTNMFLLFSSNRPGGQGGYDLYFTGINFEE
jgi:hypothetical protein